MFKVPERYRWKNPAPGYESTAADGNNGLFNVPQKRGNNLKCLASDGLGWDHVSVSLPNRCPTWDEMCYIKDLFWDRGDSIIQFHPPESEYVNYHPNCLHLWRPHFLKIPLPPGFMVGPKTNP